MMDRLTNEASVTMENAQDRVRWRPAIGCGDPLSEQKKYFKIATVVRAAWNKKQGLTFAIHKKAKVKTFLKITKEKC